MIVQSNGNYDKRDKIIGDLKECTVNEFILVMVVDTVLSAWIFEPYNCKQVFIGFDPVNDKYYFGDKEIVHHFESTVEMSKKEWLLLIWSELNLDVPDILTSNTNREECNNVCCNSL